MGEDNKINQSCKDCIIESFSEIIRALFSIIRVFIYVLSAIAISSNSSEILKNLWGFVK